MKEFIDKLIERLEEISVSRDNDGVINGCNMGICEDDDCLKCMKKKIISIVNGLAEEYNNDFCEWEYDDFEDGWQTSCGTTFSLCDSDKEITHYCPCCGKKIKVVE